MKRLFSGIALAAFSLLASATTLNPVQLLNPTGSTSGQTIVSTGASSAPGWANMTVAHVTGAAALTGATFTGDVTVSEPSAALIMNDTSGSGFPQFVYRSNGTNEWIVFDAPSTHTFTVNRYVSGAFQDMPLTVSNSTGAVTMTDGITGSPISGSTGSFTTLAASSTVSGAGFTSLFSSPSAIGNTTPSTGAFTTLSASSTVSGTGFSTYLASPPAIGGTAAAAGKFTTLQATSAITPSTTAGIVGTTAADNANAGSIGEVIQSSTFTSLALTNNTLTNATSISLTAGDWDVYGHAMFVGANTTAITFVVAGISTTSATLPAVGLYCQQTASWPTNGAVADCSAPLTRINVSSPTTVYFVVESGFNTSTLSVSGFLRARRIR